MVLVEGQNVTQLKKKTLLQVFKRPTAIFHNISGTKISEQMKQMLADAQSYVM